MEIKKSWVEKLSANAILELLQHPNRCKLKVKVRHIRKELYDAGFSLMSNNWVHEDMLDNVLSIETGIPTYIY